MRQRIQRRTQNKPLPILRSVFLAKHIGKSYSSTTRLTETIRPGRVITGTAPTWLPHWPVATCSASEPMQNRPTVALLLMAPDSLSRTSSTRTDGLLRMSMNYSTKRACTVQLSILILGETIPLLTRSAPVISIVMLGRCRGHWLSSLPEIADLVSSNPQTGGMSLP